ncbi:hypothetical protein PTKIN_Ptkin01aG0056100 [Pterospermum kingtungense]
MLKQSASRNQRYKGFKKAIKLGRKDLDREGDGSSAENNEGGDRVEAGKAVESEDDGRGGLDDEIDDEHEREKAEVEESEEVEDLIDEEDREKDNQIEDLSLLEDQTMSDEGDENLQDLREEQYRSDDHDASSAVLQSSLDTGIAAQIRRLTSVDEMVKNDEQKGKEIVTSFSAALSR